jgi:Xaa-Pro aminopeptidase
LFNSALLIVSREEKEPELFLFVQDDQLVKAKTFFATLNAKGLVVLAYSELGSKLKIQKTDINVAIDGLSCTHLAYESLKSNASVKELSGAKAPVSKLKIIKSCTEIDGLRKALARESASLISFYA